MMQNNWTIYISFTYNSKQVDNKLAAYSKLSYFQLEEEDIPDTEQDESNQPSQISLFREVLTDSGEIKRVLYFRKSKFRPTGTQLHQISKMSTKMDYEDACKNTGLPEVFNRATRPADLGNYVIHIFNLVRL